MHTNIPKVSIGLPVYNGDRYLEKSLDALVSQTYGNFELIISDNASTDRTEEICRAYASKYPFIRYYRNATNIGGFRNNNRVIDLATGKYFLLTGHDDLRDPQQLSRCVDVLEQNEKYVLSYVMTTYIDENDRVLRDKEVVLKVDSDSVHERFRELIRMDHKVEPVYGLIRLQALGDIRFGLFADSDRVLVAAIALRGPFYRIPERLFFRRFHTQQSTAVYRSRYARSEWLNPGKGSRRFVFPYIRQGFELFAAVRRSGLDLRTKRRCYAAVAAWMRTNRYKMTGDLKRCLKESVRPLAYRIRGLIGS